jgi:hypothetical protein
MITGGSHSKQRESNSFNSMFEMDTHPVRIGLWVSRPIRDDGQSYASLCDQELYLWRF